MWPEATLQLFFFQAEGGIRAFHVTGVQTCALPIWWPRCNVWRAMRCTWATAVPSDTPDFRSKEMVTAGSCPAWLTVSGPTLEPSVAREASGTRLPLFERM